MEDISTKVTGHVQDARLDQANRLYQTGFMLIYGKKKSVDKGIKCIQKAITLIDSDYKYWQLLGEAYYQRGSLNPAINCFSKSLKLAEDVIGGDDETRRKADCTYCRLRMSDIRLSVGQLSEAILGYQDIVETDQDNVAALVGLSKTNLFMARNNFQAGLVKAGHSHCMDALRYSLKAIKLSPDLCFTWKLASDCCLVQFVHGQRGNFETRIDEKFVGASSETGILINRLSVIDLAQQFLCKAIAIEPFEGNGCLWHNLGLTLYFKCTIMPKSQERQLLLERSLRCLLKALKFDRCSSQIKNTIGVVAFNLKLLNTAQSYMIKSIRANKSTSEIQFSNLGFIYSQQGEFRLADAAFNRSQAEEPLYSRSWLGNAILMEQKNRDNLTQLRQCHKLEHNYESHLMYATKVATLPQTEDFSHDTLYALDSMQRLINYDENCIEACNTLGLLYERCNLKEQARSLFERALMMEPTDSRVIFNLIRQHDVSTSCPFSDSFESIKPADSDLIKSAGRLAAGGNLEYALNYIHFLFNNKDYKNVNLRMTQFIDMLHRDDIRNRTGAQILLGLAAKADGGDFKSWLFKNIIDAENITAIENLINYLTLMLVGSSTKDALLVDQISDDLMRKTIAFITSKSNQFLSVFYSPEGRWLRLLIFCSVICLKDKAKLVKSLLVSFPYVAELWLYMGLTMMQTGKAPSALECVKKANLLGTTNPDLCSICDLLSAILCQSTQKQDIPSARLNHLSRAIHKRPSLKSSWGSLFPELVRNKKDKNNQSHVFCHNNLYLFDSAVDQIIDMILVL